MRTRFIRSVGVLALALAGGCDDTKAGQLAEDPAPPKLVKVMVQDERARGGLGFVTDLLHTAGAEVCSETRPCLVPFTVGFETIGGDCEYAMPSDTEGKCPNPLAARPVAIGSPIAAGGVSVRMVFSKLLDPSIEEVKTDDKGVKQYILTAGTIKLLDGQGMEVAATAYWDPTGSPTETFDPVISPYGPAIVLVPDAPLDVKSTYSIVLDTSKVFDRKKQGPTDDKGTNLPNPYKIDFTTEDLHDLGSAPDNTDKMGDGDPDGKLDPTIKPDDVIQIYLNADVDETTAVGTLTTGMQTIPVEIWNDRGADPMDCDASLDPRTLDIVAISTPGNPVDLAEGDYVLTIDGLKDASGTGTPFKKTFMFSVKGPKDDMDPMAVANFILPEACGAAPADDMSMSPDDGGTDGGAPDDMSLPQG